MKICINATIVDRRSTGLGIYTISVLRELVKLGAEISVFTSSPEMFEGIEAKFYRVNAATQAANGFKGHLKRVAWSQSILPLKIIRNYDLLFVPTPLEATYFCPIPQVIVVHDLLPFLYPDYYPRQQFYFRKILPKILKKSSLVITVSENTRNDVLKYYALESAKVVTILNCFNDLNLSPSENNRSDPEAINNFGKYFLYVGNLFPHKNLYRLIESLSKLNRKDIKLLIVGHKDERFYPDLFKKGVELGLSDNLIFLDYIKSHELRNLYKNSMAFIYPSLYEGFGMPPLEAMANGTPVIVSNTSSLPEVVGNAGEYIDPENTKSISEAMARMIDDESRRAELIKLGYERIKEFSWEKTTRKLMDNIAVIMNN